VKAIEALWAMTEGENVSLYWPDCEIFQLVGLNAIGLFYPDYSELEASRMTTTDFLKFYPDAEFVIYEEK